jgi:SNF2 family DNA or RNA helicase
MKTELTLQNGRVYVRTPYASAVVDRFRLIPGRQFHGDTKAWSFPAVRDVLLMVCDAVGVLALFLPDDLKAIVKPEALAKVELDLSVLNGLEYVTRPYAHQKHNLARLLANKRWLLADEMGTGKSKAVVDRLIHGPEYLPCLILCPKTCIRNWLDQLATHGRMVALCDSATTTLPTVMNYERMLCQNGFEPRTLPFWRTLILDEVHRLKNYTAKTTRAVRELSKHAQYVYGLSGTPAPNGLEDWHGVLSVIDPELLPVKSRKEFRNRYCVMERLPDSFVRVVRGYRNVHELHGYINQITSRVTKAECLDLPPKIVAPRYVTLQGDQATIYRDLKKNAVTTLTSLKKTGQLTAKNILTEALRLLQITGGFVPDDDGVMHATQDNVKVDALRELLEEMEEDKQVVIWCAFREEVAYLEQWLQHETGATVATMTGASTTRERSDNLHAFKAGAARFFVATAPTGGVGINGLEVADTEIYFSRSWSLVDWLQSQDRLHRIGQKNKVTIIPLVALATIDERVNEALARKHDLQEMMLQAPESFF